jgi:hypothetical protein
LVDIYDETLKKEPRPFISIYWRCCHVYTRVYRHRQQPVYEGCCPRCRRRLRVPIGSQGTSQRMFIAE